MPSVTETKPGRSQLLSDLGSADGFYITQSKVVVDGSEDLLPKHSMTEEEGSPLADILSQDVLKTNMLSALNGLEGHFQKLMEEDPLVDFTSYSQELSLVIRNTDRLYYNLLGVLGTIVGVLELPDNKLSSGQISSLKKEREEVLKALGYLESVRIETKRYKPNGNEEEIIEFLLAIPLKDSEKKTRLPKPEELREYILDILYRWLDDVTKGSISLSDVVLFRSANGLDYNIISFFETLENNTQLNFIKKYLSIAGDIYGYGRGLAAREMSLTALDNYTDTKSLINAYKGLSKVGGGDADVQIIYHRMHILKDAGITPPTERFRTATLMYETVGVVNLIQERDKFYPNYYQKLLSDNPAWNQEYRSFGLSDSDATRKILFTKARLLREQSLLKWLTQAEAEFLIVNLRRVMPFERQTQNNLSQSRAVVAIFSGYGPVREDGFKTQEEINAGSLFTEAFRLRVDAGRIIYEINLDRAKLKVGGKTSGTILIENNMVFWRKNNREEPIELSSDVDCEVNGGKFNLLSTIQHLQKYGGRTEVVAKELFLPTNQAAQADTGYTWGFNKATVPLSQLYPYVMRYASRNYIGMETGMARIFKRLLKTWVSQANINSPVDGRNQTLAKLMSSSNINMADSANEGLYASNMETVEKSRLSDNIRRAKAIQDILSAHNGIFGYSDINLFDLPDLENNEDAAIKIADKLRVVRKHILYFIDMFDIYEVYDMVDPWSALGYSKDGSTAKLALDKAREAKSNKERSKFLKKARSALAQDMFLAILKESISESVISVYYRKAAGTVNHSNPNVSKEIENVLKDTSNQFFQKIAISLSALKWVLVSSIGSRMKNEKDWFNPFVAGTDKYEADQVGQTDFKRVYYGEGIITSLFNGAIKDASKRHLISNLTSSDVNNGLAFNIFVETP